MIQIILCLLIASLRGNIAEDTPSLRGSIAEDTPTLSMPRDTGVMPRRLADSPDNAFANM